MDREITWQDSDSAEELTNALNRGEEVLVRFPEAAREDLEAMARGLDPLNELPDLRRSSLYPVQVVLGAARYSQIGALAQAHDAADGNGYLVDLDPDAGTMHFHK
jgi:hypothetical protein